MADDTEPSAESGPPLVLDAIGELRRAAISVLYGKPVESLREPLQKLDALLALRDTATAEIVIDRARDIYGDNGDIDVDDGTIAYHNETDGWWVLGWLWVSEQDLPWYEDREELEEFFAAKLKCKCCYFEWEDDWGNPQAVACPICGQAEKVSILEEEGDDE